MIRRLFWMIVGAVLGVSGYRKAATLAHAVSPARARARAAGRLARGARATAGFARDVREGMAIYRLAEVRRAPTLERHPHTQDWAYAKAVAATGFPDEPCPDEVKDGH
jgi:hypothetical protein